MKKLLLISIYLFFSTSIFAQNLSDKIDVENFQNAFFREILLNKINHLRDSLQKEKLISNEILQQSADFHAEFLSKEGKMTHFQTKSKYKDAHTRALTFGLEKDFVWENMLSCLVLQPTYISYQKGNKKVTINTYQDLLNFMYNGFLALEANAVNMKSEKVKETGIGIYLDKKTKHIYIVQVFSH